MGQVEKQIMCWRNDSCKILEQVRAGVVQVRVVGALSREERQVSPVGSECWVVTRDLEWLTKIHLLVVFVEQNSQEKGPQKCEAERGTQVGLDLEST